jgi:hypothetical protein
MAMQALQHYGSGSDSENDDDTEPVQGDSVDSTRHLQPLESGKSISTLHTSLSLNAAPVVASKVQNLFSLSMYLCVLSPHA